MTMSLRLITPTQKRRVLSVVAVLTEALSMVFFPKVSVSQTSFQTVPDVMPGSESGAGAGSGSGARSEAAPGLRAHSDPVMVPRLVGHSDRPVFELVPHQAPPPGYKIFVTPLPLTDDGHLKNQRASVRFFVKKTTDTCNRVGIFGSIQQQTLASSNFEILKLVIETNSISRTLKSCMNREKVERTIEITTPLSEPFQLRDTAVIYLPENVDATVEYWSAKP